MVLVDYDYADVMFFNFICAESAFISMEVGSRLVLYEYM